MKNEKKPNRLLRVDQVAERLNVSVKSTYRLIAMGCFEGCRVGGSIRIFENSVDAYIERQAISFSEEVGYCVNLLNK